MSIKQGQNNTFHGNTIIAIKGIKIGNGSIMKKFINWTDVDTSLETPFANLNVNQLVYNQIGDEVKLLIDLSIELVTISTTIIPIQLNNLPDPISVNSYYNNTIFDVDGINKIDGRLQIVKTAGNQVLLQLRTAPVLINIGETVNVVGEVNYTTKN